MAKEKAKAKATAKEKEWKEYHTTVSEFELRKYLGR